MNSSNLTPQKRLDKNGRLVTKHVRIQPNPNQKKLSIPKVFGIKAEMGVFGLWSEKDNQDVSKMLIALDQENLLQLRDIMMDCDNNTREQLQGIIRRRAMSAAMSGATSLDTDIQYSALLLPVLNAIHAKDGGYKLDEKYIPTVFGRTGPENILSGTESEQNRVKGYCMMAQARFSMELEHEDTEWFGAHSEELLPHFDRIREMSYFDREFCEDIIRSESPSMSSGIL
jgi:hypothetical protein